MYRIKLILTVGIVVIAIPAIFILGPFNGGEIKHITNNIQTETESHWKERINKVGGANAYREFSESIAGLTTGKHTQAHVFGGALYTVEGFDGLAVCDQHFLYGCMHEVVGRAILERGIGSAKDLSEECINTLKGESSFCQHGIGHGLQAYFGYTLKDLSNALNVCDTIPTSDTNRIGGCYGGIFMEYNLQSMLASDGEVRVSDSYLEPCTQLDEKHLPACIYWQSQWWRNGPLSSFGTDGEVFKEMGKYCYEITTKRNLIDICFQGIGNIIAPGVDFDTDLSIHMCKEATSSDRDNTICRIAAAKRTVDGPGAQVANQICVGLLEYDFKDCFSQVEINSNNKN